MVASIAKPGRKDFSYIRGDTFSRTITIKTGPTGGPLTPMDLTGYAVTVPLYAEFPIPPHKNPIGSITATIVAPETDGRISLVLTTSQTEDLPPKVGFRLRIFQIADPPNTTTTLFEGILSAC